MGVFMIKVTSIKTITKTSYKGKVYNLELESKTTSTEREDQYFIDAGSGMVTHNCFPKDISALINYAKTKDIQTPLLRAVWERNVIVDRPERDWEILKGRAISTD